MLIKLLQQNLNLHNPKAPTQLYGFCYIFVFAILFFLYWKTEARQNLILIWLILSATILCTNGRRISKKSQGGFESALGLLSTGQWLSIPFINWTIFCVYCSKEV
jgi:prolipoprotein diacylglyceryltransferase